MRRGIPISPGIVVAHAFRMDEAIVRAAPGLLDESGLKAEITRFDRACQVVGRELDEVIRRVREEVGETAASIFRAHQSMLLDPGFVVKVRDYVLNQHVDAVTALELALEDYTTLFSRIPDEFLRERISDIRDVVGRIISYLVIEASQQKLSHSEPIILVAPEILPSQTVMFDKLRVAGIVTESGGSSGHAAILARSLGIPAISGLTGLLKEVHTGDLLVIDAREGMLFINPGPETESTFRKMAREYSDLQNQLVENRDLESITTDGQRIDLLINANNVLDAASGFGVGAGGIGLYRTEYLFLTHPTVPDEEEQRLAYSAVMEAVPNLPVTIRTLDLGGDKRVSYLGNLKEPNPFMGWRSIRLMSEYPGFFRTQMRAILRAAVNVPVKVLIPMISSAEEVLMIREMYHSTLKELTEQGIQHACTPQFGIMVEVPSAALSLESLLPMVDFVSIGSNDLTQYLMAADRDNPKVAHLCDPFYPAIYRVLQMIVTACERHQKPVTLCGEMASRPRCLLPLLGMGLKQFSMSAGFLPTAKEIIRRVSVTECQKILEKVLGLVTAREVKQYLQQEVERLAPQVAQLDVS